RPSASSGWASGPSGLQRHSNSFFCAMRGHHAPLAGPNAQKQMQASEAPLEGARPLVVHLQPTYDVVATFDLSLAAEALGHNGARNLTTYLLSVRAAYAARTSSGADGAGAVVC